MTTFQKILVPVDFSIHSAEAIEVAADLAQRYTGTLTLVHVHDPVPYVLPDDYELHTPEQRVRLINELEKGLAAAKRGAQAAGAAKVDTRLLQGWPAPAIVEFAQTGKFDSIVMGTHGRTGIKHALMGSVAEKVVRSATCPVLTVRSRDELAQKLS
jgi:nucleotide-binding universal stress UspA family protein